jgi:hypothetical protein
MNFISGTRRTLQISNPIRMNFISGRRRPLQISNPILFIGKMNVCKKIRGWSSRQERWIAGPQLFPPLSTTDTRTFGGKKPVTAVAKTKPNITVHTYTRNTRCIHQKLKTNRAEKSNIVACKTSEGRSHERWNEGNKKRRKNGGF